MKRIYAEIGIGNESFVSTEIEENGNEYRIPKFIKPKKSMIIIYGSGYSRKCLLCPPKTELRQKQKRKIN